ncbi:hypothetical protein CEP53_015277, partial [Fusarium sp. AF-6]
MAGDLHQICTYIVEVAKEAGNIINNAWPTTLTTSSKKNTADIVTETDHAVEKLIRERLTARYPSFCFVGEESSKAGLKITDQPTFIVDPIDGTSNFVHGLPDVCVSIGLVKEHWKESWTQLKVQEFPPLDSDFWKLDDSDSRVAGRGELKCDFCYYMSGPKSSLKCERDTRYSDRYPTGPHRFLAFHGTVGHEQQKQGQPTPIEGMDGLELIDDAEDEIGGAADGDEDSEEEDDPLLHTTPTQVLKRVVSTPSLASSNITTATVVKAAWATVLAKVTGKTDIVFGHLISGRNVSSVPGIESIVGPCLNVVPVRVCHQPSWTVLHLLQHIQKQQVDNMPYESLGFREIIDKCTDWDDDGTNGFSTIVQHQSMPQTGALEIGGNIYQVGAMASQEDAADFNVVTTPQSMNSTE